MTRCRLYKIYRPNLIRPKICWQAIFIRLSFLFLFLLSSKGNTFRNSVIELLRALQPRDTFIILRCTGSINCPSRFWSDNLHVHFYFGHPCLQVAGQFGSDKAHQYFSGKEWALQFQLPCDMCTCLQWEHGCFFFFIPNSRSRKNILF
jgi:hypothetical protein